jgi:hypothetical protein
MLGAFPVSLNHCCLAVAPWFETREDALLTMEGLIQRSPLLGASRRMKPLKWKMPYTICRLPTLW